MYTVWLPMLPGDARDRWSPDHITDGRAVHFWDGDQKLGKWFSANVDSCPHLGDVAWDAYFLFDGSAKWEGSSLGPVRSCGTPVVNEGEKFSAALAEVLSE